MLTTLLALSLVQSPSMDVRLMRYPDVSGDQVVFTYASDLWTVGLEGGVAKRLTGHAGLEFRAKFSPDGKWIAFSGQYDGDTDVYVVSSQGGEPKRLTFNAGNDMVCEWTPGGRIAYISGREQVRPGPAMLWTISPTGGMPTRTDVHEAVDVSFSADGGTLAYNRSNSHQFNWRRYRGGTQGRVSFFDFSSKKYSEMPSGREQNYFPMWIGDNVYYISDLNQGTLNLYKFDPKSKKKSQITKFEDADIRWPSTDGKSIVFERNGHMFAFDITTNAAKEIKTSVVSDQLQRRPYYRNVSQFINYGFVSPSGKRLVIAARGDLFSVPAENGETRNISNTQGAREEMPTWSPDGQEIAFISDKDGEARLYTMPQMGGDWKLIKTPESQVIAGIDYSPDSKKILVHTEELEHYIIDLATGESKFVFKDPQAQTTTDWSADGKWIAYIKNQKNIFGAVYLYDVEKGESHQITDAYYDDTSVAFDLNGKYLYLVSARTFAFAPSAFEIDLHQSNTQRVYVLPLKADMRNPMEKVEDEEPVKPKEVKPAEEKKAEVPPTNSIDLDGLANRAIALDVPAGSYPFLVGAKDGVFTYQDGALIKIDVATGKPTTILAGANGFSFTPDRTKIAYQSGPTWGITSVKPGIAPGTGRVDLGSVTMTIDPVQEWRQMVGDAWRYERDNFYDKGMQGLDWNAIGKKYTAMIASAGDRSDVSYVLGMMVGELGTGHSYVQGGDFGPAPSTPPVGMLGVDYGVIGDRVVINKIYSGLNYEASRRGPLGAPGVDVKEGDTLLEIDGKPVDASQDVHALLVGKANKEIKIAVSSKTDGSEKRTYKVTPVSSEQQLRYIEWVNGNRKRVEELSGGRIGYVHVPNTQFQGITEFIKGYYAQSDKQAFVVDERYNGGGFIPTFFGERLLRPIVTGIQQRHGEDYMYPTQSWDGPKVMLINKYAGSGGDHLPWLFRYLKIGPLIGTRTWGGLVGITGGRPLVDGGSVTAPEFALYDLETGQIIAENKGIDPDIEVDDTPDLVSQGRDPELEAAVKYLLDELKKGRKPYAKPKFLSKN